MPLITTSGKAVELNKKYKFVNDYMPKQDDTMAIGDETTKKISIPAGTVCEIVEVVNEPNTSTPMFECKFTLNDIEYSLTSYANNILEEVTNGGRRKKYKSKSRKSRKVRKTRKSRRN